MQAPSSHRARDALIAAGRLIPGIWAYYEAERDRSASAPEVYIQDDDGARAYAAAGAAAYGRPFWDQLRSLEPIDLSMQIYRFNTLASWRMGQGIYRVDPAPYDALVTTELNGDLPTDVLLRLPEWCVYVETPGLQCEVDSSGHRCQVFGAWARITREPEHANRPALVIALDLPAVPIPTQCLHIPLTGSLADSIAGVMALWGRPDPASLQSAVSCATPIINILLYLCAGGEVTGNDGSPANPNPVKTRRRGVRLFPAAGPRVWDVGVRVGAALRRAYAGAEQDMGGDGRSLRGHVRRAHWHGVRSGPRKTPDGADIPTALRQFKLRWFPPIPVALDDLDNLPSVIRPVSSP